MVEKKRNSKKLFSFLISTAQFFFDTCHVSIKKTGNWRRMRTGADPHSRNMII